MTATISPLPARKLATVGEFIATLSSLESTMAWLDKNGLEVISFGCTPRGPTINIKAHPVAYILARGSAWRRNFQQVGAQRIETWAFRGRDGIEIAWKEIVCVH